MIAAVLPPVASRNGIAAAICLILAIMGGPTTNVLAAPFSFEPVPAEPLFTDYAAYLAQARTESAYTAYVLQPGEEPDDLFRRVGAGGDAAQLAEALDRGLEGFNAQHGQTIHIALASSGATPFEIAAGAEPWRVDRLRVVPEGGVEVVVWRENGDWQVRRDTRPVTTSYAVAASVMTDSLFGAGARAEVPRAIMARMANLFLYDVDFVRDIRRGDRFEVVWEVMHGEDGRPAGTGDIVYAGMTWRGGREAKSYYRFADAPGADAAAPTLYFDESGASARRLLMKTPIEGARVTSRFGPRRHPTLGYTKAHKGVDFGARSGTPIMAAGDGTVVRANRYGSYGNYLLIRHANGFETAYAHLKGFGRGIEKGARVRQGEVVAYVGSTGRSTGPHLHYEVRSGGEQVNPMKIEAATGMVLDGEDLEAFLLARARIEAIRAPRQASASSSGASGLSASTALD